MKNELQTLRLFSPLFPNIYRKNEWGDYENEPENLDASELLEYEDEILERIEKEKLPNEGERGLAVYLDDDLSQKAHSLNPSVEEWNGELWGVTEVQTHDDLDIRCEDGAIIIGSADPVKQLPPQLMELFDSLGVSHDTIRCVLEGGAEDE